MSVFRRLLLTPPGGLLLGPPTGLLDLVLDLLDYLLGLLDGVLCAETGLGEQALTKGDGPG